MTFPQLEGRGYGAAVSPGIPAPMNNALVKDREVLDPADVHLDPMDSARSKLAQYEQRLASLGGNPQSKECRPTMKAADFKGKKFNTDWGQPLTWEDETGKFPEFYDRYVKALCSGLAQLREDVQVMSTVKDRVPCIAGTESIRKGAMPGLMSPMHVDQPTQPAFARPTF
jgi:hypothetical protein